VLASEAVTVVGWDAAWTVIVEEADLPPLLAVTLTVPADCAVTVVVLPVVGDTEAIPELLDDHEIVAVGIGLPLASYAVALNDTVFVAPMRRVAGLVMQPAVWSRAHRVSLRQFDTSSNKRQ
jgi:hypothetical protein